MLSLVILSSLVTKTAKFTCALYNSYKVFILINCISCSHSMAKTLIIYMTAKCVNLQFCQCHTYILLIIKVQKKLLENRDNFVQNFPRSICCNPKSMFFFILFLATNLLDYYCHCQVSIDITSFLI